MERPRWNGHNSSECSGRSALFAWRSHFLDAGSAARTFLHSGFQGFVPAASRPCIGLPRRSTARGIRRAVREEVRRDLADTGGPVMEAFALARSDADDKNTRRSIAPTRPRSW